MIGPVRMEPKAIEEAGWTRTDQLVLLVTLYLWGCCMENSFFRNEGVGGASYQGTWYVRRTVRYATIDYYSYQPAYYYYYYYYIIIIILVVIVVLLFLIGISCCSVLSSNFPYSMG